MCTQNKTTDVNSTQKHNNHQNKITIIFFTDYFVKLLTVALCPVLRLVYEYRVDGHRLTSAQVFVLGHPRYQLLKPWWQHRSGNCVLKRRSR